MRLVKQVVYSAIWLVIFLALAMALYLFIFRASPTCQDNILNQNEESVDCGGSCLPCALKNLQTLQVFPVNIFDNGNQTVSLLVELKNKNEKLGIKNLPYVLNLYDRNGERLQSFAKDINIKPGANQYIIEAGIAVDPVLVGKADLVLGEPQWELMEKTAPLLQVNPNFQVQVEKNSLNMTSKVVNQNPFVISEAEVQALLLNRSGFYVAASKTTLRDIVPDSVSDLFVSFIIKPEVLATVDFSKTKVVVEVKR